VEEIIKAFAGEIKQFGVITDLTYTNKGFGYISVERVG
jgi:hypothetical protein